MVRFITVHCNRNIRRLSLCKQFHGFGCNVIHIIYTITTVNAVGHGVQCSDTAAASMLPTLRLLPYRMRAGCVSLSISLEESRLVCNTSIRVARWNLLLPLPSAGTNARRLSIVPIVCFLPQNTGLPCQLMAARLLARWPLIGCPRVNKSPWLSPRKSICTTVSLGFSLTLLLVFSSCRRS